MDGRSVDQAKAANDARTSLIQYIGSVGLVGGLFYTIRTFALAKTTQRAERFTKAIGHVGDKDSLTARAGGAYSLGSLAAEERSYWPIIGEVLAALVRERANASTVTAEVQAALTVIGRRPAEVSAATPPIDLRGAQLQGVKLAGANLENCWLMRAVLDDADLTDSRFRGSNLSHVSLKGAELASADLSETDLSAANLEDANLYRTRLANAVMSGTILTGARNLVAQQLAPGQAAASINGPTPLGEVSTL